MDIKTLIKKWWFWVIVVAIIGGIGAAMNPQSKDTEEDKAEQTSQTAEKANEAYMDAMRKCTVMEAADIYTADMQKTDNVFDEANETCRATYKNVYNGDDDTFVSDMAADWADRKGEMIEDKPLEHYLDVLGW